MKERKMYTLVMLYNGYQVGETKFATLKAIDSRTTGFISKEDYIKNRLQDIAKKTEKNEEYYDPKNVDVKIRQYTNKKEKESHFIEPLLFHKDRSVLNEGYIEDVLLNHCMDPKFVLGLISKYKNANGLKSNYLLVKNTINEPNKFSQHFLELMDKVLKSYKASRDVYLYSEKYKHHNKDYENYKEEKMTPIPINNSLGIYESDDEYLNYLLSRDDPEAKSEIIERYGAEYLNIHNIPIVDGAQQPDDDIKKK